ncbi:MAG: Mu transposase C-terminal domain-containing protein [Candidatus Eisenbacteria sp.]|nr:Mu transposase C-terminal domain-containing protein [Candidatus Eisenbacteria bacterium]
MFRYGLIGETTRPLADEVLAQTLARIAAQHHQLPDGLLRRFSGATLRRFLAGAEQTLIRRMGPEEIDHAFMARITRLVSNDSTVKVNGIFYEVPPRFVGARVDLRFPIGRLDELILYREDQPVARSSPCVSIGGKAGVSPEPIGPFMSHFRNCLGVSRLSRLWPFPWHLVVGAAPSTHQDQQALAN